MAKEINKWLFMLFATLFNIVLLILIAMVLIIAAGYLLSIIQVPPAATSFIFFLIIGLAVFITYQLYIRFFRFLEKKYNWKIPPLFKRRDK